MGAIKLAGELYGELPPDLYIPPDALSIFLEAFEGPLDLLLYLIKRQNLDIIHIPIAQITRQYMHYIDLMGTLQMELAAEYLLMAALLAEIKSRSLLPQAANNEADEQEEDPRAVLVQRLQDYERIKHAAENLDVLPRVQRDIFLTQIDTSNVECERSEPIVELPELTLALQKVLHRVKQLSHHLITKEPLSVRERMGIILQQLESQTEVCFIQLFSYTEGRAGVVVTFLAILELSKAELIDILQAAPFSAIHISKRITA